MPAGGVKLSAPTVLVVAAVVAAAAFAVGRSTSTPPEPVRPEPMAREPAPGPVDPQQELPPGHPPTGDLPPGHPATSGMPPGHPPMGADPGAGSGAAAQEGTLKWTAPAKWQSVPNTSSMRLATWRVPKLAGDVEDPEIYVMQAGGSVDANVQRWIGQFDEAGQKTAKRSERTVKGLKITVLEVEGKFMGGMGPGKQEEDGWALLGAIVETPGSPYFFKMTGPKKSVQSARPDFDALLSSLQP